MENNLFVVFRLGEEEYAVSAAQVKEIDRMNEIKINIVPAVPDYIEGIINLRGDVVPVINPQKKFGIEAVHTGKKQRIVILNMRSYLMGMLVDSVSGSISLSESDLLPPTEAMLEKTPYVSAVARKDNRMMFILDIDKVSEPQ